MDTGTYKKMRSNEEEQDQKALAQYLDMLGLLWCHVPNGGARNVVVGAKLKRQGVKRGVPDNFIFDIPPACPTAKGVVIELKRKKGGKVSKEQKEWLEHLRSRGWLAYVCEGIDEAIKTIQNLGYGRLKK